MLTLIKSSKYGFVLYLLLYFTLFYGASYVTIALTSRGGFYLPLIEHINFVQGFRSVLLNCSSVVLSLAGVDNYFTLGYLKVYSGARVHLNDACLGLGIMSFWWAMVLAFPVSKRIKAKYFLGGTLLIVCLNITRISLLAYIYSSSLGRKFSNVDHHFVFNVVIYIAVSLLLYKWINLYAQHAASGKKAVLHS